jgi:Fe2+ transport system protein B
MRRLEVSLDRLANRLEAMAVHHEQQFASAVDNIGDIEVIYIHPFYCYFLVLLFLLLIFLLLFRIEAFLLFCSLSLLLLQSLSHFFPQSTPLSPLPSFLLSVHESSN